MNKIICPIKYNSLPNKIIFFFRIRGFCSALMDTRFLPGRTLSFDGISRLFFYLFPTNRILVIKLPTKFATADLDTSLCLFYEHLEGENNSTSGKSNCSWLLRIEIISPDYVFVFGRDCCAY